jgi:hypothetical protein
MLVQQTTTPLKGWAKSKSDSSISKVAGGVVIASLVSLPRRTGRENGRVCVLLAETLSARRVGS